MNNKKLKQMEYQERKRQEQALADAAEAEAAENDAAPTPGVVVEDKGPRITGLTGELALQKAGKNARKKLLEE